MSFGIIASQVVAFVSLPILTRVFSAEDWGIAGSILAVSAFLSMVFTMRFEVAIVLTRTISKANALLKLCFCLSTFLFACTLIFLMIFDDKIINGLGGAYTKQTLYLIPSLAVTMAISSALTFYCSRFKDFGGISLTMLVQQSFYNICSGILGVFTQFFNGLIFGKVVALVVAVLLMFIRSKKFIFSSHKNSDHARMIEVAKEYAKFPMYSFPYSMLVVSSKETVLIIFGVMFDPALTGAFVLARTLIYAPVGVISSIFGQVTYNEFTALHKKGGNTKNLIMLLKAIIITCGPGYVLFAGFAEEIFMILFGGDWKLSSNIFVMLMPAGFLMLFTAWMDRIFEVMGHQRRMFWLQLVFEVITVAGLLGSISLQFEFEAVVLIYAVMLGLYNALFLAISLPMVLSAPYSGK